MAKSQTVLQRKDTTSNSALYISFDLGDKSWQLGLARCHPLAGDAHAF